MKNCDFIELEVNDFENFFEEDFSKDDVININLVMNSRQAIEANQTGELGLLVERILEQNIILNLFSREYTNIHIENLNFIKSMKENTTNDNKKKMMAYFLEKGKEILGEVEEDKELSYALIPYLGGSANMFLENPRSKYANKFLMQSCEEKIDLIQPGEIHKINLYINDENRCCKYKEYLEKCDCKLNTSKCRFLKLF